MEFSLEAAANLRPPEFRSIVRRNEYHGQTSGFCAGYVQANLVVLPASLADDFEEFCRRNSAPLPLLYRSEPGDSAAPPLAENSDVKTDLPRYRIYSNGRMVEDTFDLCGFENDWSDKVSFYLGCSYTFEPALSARRIGTMSSIYLTNIQLYRVGSFAASMFATMRKVKKNQLIEAFRVTCQYPDFHGAPIHIGNPARIGLANLSVPNVGNPPVFEEDEVPVFWACGVTGGEAIASAAPPLAFSHSPGCMFITDVEANPKQITDSDDIDIMKVSRERQPFFASVIEVKSINIISKLEKILLDDPGKRGIVHLHQASELLKAVLALSHANRVAITTGFPVNTENKVKEETDGLPGALSICQSLLALDKEVVLISDSENVGLFESCVDKMVSLGALKTPVKVIPCQEAIDIWNEANVDAPPWDCLLAIERAGRAKDGKYHSMSNKLVSVEPVDDLFEMASRNPLVSTIGIGDGGNELGMGKVYEQVVKHIPHGEKIACEIPTDFVVVAGVSNWAGYAVSLGLYVASCSPIHWRYRNYGINADDIPNFNVMDFLPTNDQIRDLLVHMNNLGVTDGTNGRGDQYVDGLPLCVHLKKVEELKCKL